MTMIDVLRSVRPWLPRVTITLTHPLGVEGSAGDVAAAAGSQKVF